MLAEVKKSLDVADFFQQHQGTYSYDQLPTVASYREQFTALVIRYRCNEDNLVHRLQLMFETPQQFNVVWEYLKRIRCPLQCLPAAQSKGSPNTSYPPPGIETVHPRQVVSRTFSALQRDDDSVADALPPRREPPVPRPTSVPASTTLKLPALPKPTLASDLQDHPRSATTSSNRKSSPSIVARDVLPVHETARRSTRLAASESESRPRPKRHMTANASKIMRASTPYRHDSDSLVNTAEATTSTVTPKEPSLTEFLAANEENLAKYAAQSYETRSQALNELVLEELDNPYFQILCEDVEACWRRFGLDLGKTFSTIRI